MSILLSTTVVSPSARLWCCKAPGNSVVRGNCSSSYGRAAVSVRSGLGDLSAAAADKREQFRTGEVSPAAEDANLKTRRSISEVPFSCTFFNNGLLASQIFQSESFMKFCKLNSI